MSKVSRVLVLLYLMTMSSASLYGTYSVWAAVPDAPLGAPAEPVLDDSEAPADGSPLIVDLDPREFVIGSRRPSVRVIGHNFTGSSGVLVDGTPREAELVGPKELLVRFAASDFVAPGPMMLTVSNPAAAAEDGSPAGAVVSTRGDTLESLSIDAQAITAEAGKLFELQLTATGGTAPYTWTIRPPLPPDLTLDDKGLVSGTPQAAATQTHTVTVTDAKGTVVETEIDVEVT